MALLDHLPEYADKLDKKTVVDKIWPNLVGIMISVSDTCNHEDCSQQTGFSDTVPVIREATVKAIILISDKVCSL